MNITTTHAKAAKISTDCLIIAVSSKKHFSEQLQDLDLATDGLITKWMKQGDLAKATASTLLIHNPKGLAAKRLLLIRSSKKKAISAKEFQQLATAVANTLNPLPVLEVTSLLSALPVKKVSQSWKVRQEIMAVEHASYRFTECKSKPLPAEAQCRITEYQIHCDKAENEAVKIAILQGQSIAKGIALTRHLSDLPGNICTPTYLARQAETLQQHNSHITTTILDEGDMQKLGMGSLLSVSKGSRQPAKLIVMEYSHPDCSSDAPIVLVGKGLTFDAGGISIKPAAAMDEMKYDMCGGASVFGTIQAVSCMQLPTRVIGIVPSSENLPDGQANKPGDIVTSMSGQTIEILNTDAEGRLILCDALTYAERFEPKCVIDIATLTGACIIALGKHAAGLMSNNKTLAKQLLQAGKTSGDRAWKFPIWEEYDQQLKSPFADMANIGGREGGSITAACFLARYTQKYHWAHLDIAGTAWNSGSNKGATGRPVPLLTQFILDQLAIS